MIRRSNLGLLVIAGVLLIFAGCEGEHDPGPPVPLQPGPEPGPGPGPEPGPEPGRADLRIAGVDVYPARPQAGSTFTVQVHVRNSGQAPSGPYDLAMFIQDVGRGSRYPIGTFRKPGLQPGEQVCAFVKNDCRVNFGGGFQVRVEIVPFEFEDADPGNNEMGYAFDVGE
jgi:hypothetical protein